MSKWIKSQIRADLSNGITQQEVDRRIKDNEYGFNHCSFKKINKRQQEQDDFILHPYEVEEGVIQCKKCNSWRVYSVSVQTRSSDEPMSVFAICTNCKIRWTQNS
jgi:DNA-directed RNA polymerase subunit M/transcription elongation factor TFIIS